MKIFFNFLVELSTVATYPGLERAWIQAMRGSFVQNDKYCSKQTLLAKFGREPVGKGGRTDRNAMFAEIKDGASDLELMHSDFASYCRFRSGIADYRSLTPPVRTNKLEVILFYGEPGCGKTELATSQFADTFRLPLGRDFWLTPYAVGKKHIVIDDFKSNLQLADLLQLLDNAPIEVPRKGNFVWWCPDTVIITTNRSPHDWYKYEDRDFEKQALFRRFTACYRFSKNAERVPRPVEIDITDMRDFLPEWPRRALTVQQVLTPYRNDKKNCRIHGFMFCSCSDAMLKKNTEDDEEYLQSLYQ